MNWKAYDEVNFSDQYILRWVREGDEYVNRITKEMMEDFKAVVSQQEKELAEAGCLIGVLREQASHHEALAHAGGFEAGYQAAKEKTLTDEEIDDIGREHLTDGDGAIEFARAILRKAQEK